MTQEVIARCFEHELQRMNESECYFKSISAELKPKRDKLVQLLTDVGLKPVIPEGGYFMLADISKIANNFETDSNEMKDSKFVKYLIKEKVNVLFIYYFILNSGKFSYLLIYLYHRVWPQYRPRHFTATSTNHSVKILFDFAFLR